MSESLRFVEAGETAPITPPEGRVVRFGTMRGRIHFAPGWDDPIGYPLDTQKLSNNSIPAPGVAR